MSLALLRHWESLDDAINSCYPMGHWPITETSGTTIKDASGFFRNGIASGTLTLNNLIAPDGRPAALFGGGHIEIADNAAFSVESVLGFTVGALVKFDAAPTGRMFILTKGGLSSNNYEWSLNGSATGQFGLTTHTSPGGTISARTTTAAAVSTAWTLLIGRVQDRAVSSRIDLYQDSNTAQAGTDATTSSGYTDTASPVRIGARTDNATFVMAGYIRNAFIVQEAISPGSVNRIVAACRREGWF